MAALLDQLKKLDSEGKTERRGAAKRISELVGQSDVADALGTGATSRKHKNLTWQKLFSASLSFFDREAASLREAATKGKGTRTKSATTVTREKTLIADATGLMRVVLKECCKRNAKFDVVSLIEKCLVVLDDVFLRKTFGSEFANVLLKDFLRSENYCKQVPRQKWIDLFDKYSDLLCDVSSFIDPLTVAELIPSIYKRMSLNCDITVSNVRRTLQVLSDAITKFSDERAFGLLEHTLACVNLYVMDVALFVPLSVRTFGETHWNLLHLWKLPRHPKLKNELVQFFCILFALHKNQPVCEWQDRFMMLREAILDDIKTLSVRERGKIKPYACHNHLATEVMHQIIILQRNETETLNFSDGSASSSSDGRNSLWAWLCHRINTALNVVVTNVDGLIIILELVTTLLERRASISQDEGILVLKEVYELEKNSKRTDVLLSSVNCLTALASCFTDVTDSAFLDQWHSAFRTTVRLLSAKDSIQSEVFLLLARLVKIIDFPDNYFDDVWKAWSCGSIQLTPGCCEFIEDYAIRRGVPRLPAARRQLQADATPISASETFLLQQDSTEDVASWILSKIENLPRKWEIERPENVSRLLFMVIQPRCGVTSPRIRSPVRYEVKFLEKLARIDTASTEPLEERESSTKSIRSLNVVNTEKRANLIDFFNRLSSQLEASSELLKAAIYACHVLLYWLLEYERPDSGESSILMKAFLTLSDSVFNSIEMLTRQTDVDPSVFDALQRLKAMLKLLAWKEFDSSESRQAKKIILRAWSSSLLKLVALLATLKDKTVLTASDDDSFMEDNSGKSLLSERPLSLVSDAGGEKVSPLPGTLLGMCCAMLTDVESDSHAVDSVGILKREISDFVLRLLEPDDGDLMFDCENTLRLCSILAQSCQLSNEMITAVFSSIRYILSKHVRNLKVVVKACRVLSSLPRHLRSSAALLDEDCADSCKTVIEGLKQMCSRDLLSPSARQELVVTLKSFTKIPATICASFDVSKLKDDLLGFLRDPSHLVRYSAASSLDVLFVDSDANRSPLESEKQKEMFAKLCDILKDYHRVRLEQPAGCDESANCCAFVLHALSQALLGSSVRRKVALFNMILLDNKDTTSAVEKALINIAVQLGYASAGDLLDNHVEYLVDSWLRSKDSLDSYPCHLHGAESLKKFVRTRADAVMPILALWLDRGQLLRFTAALRRDFGELTYWAPLCVAYVLPRIVTASGLENGIPPENLERAFLTLKSQQDVNLVLYQSFSEVLLHVLLRVFEFPDENSTDLGIIDFEEGVPCCYSTTQVKVLIDKLIENHSESITLIDLLNLQKDGIQVVLLGLRLRLLTAVDIYERKRFALILHFFAKLIMPYIGEINGEKLYLVRDIVNIVSHLANKRTNEDTKRVCISTLCLVCEPCLQRAPEVLALSLQSICSVFVDVALTVPSLTEKIVNALGDLLQKGARCQALNQSFRSLDSFPDSPIFADLRTAQKKMKVALGRKQSVPDLSLGCLLDYATEVCNNRPCSDRDLVKRLLKEFTQAVRRRETDQNILIRLAKLLGKIGPYDLQSLTLLSRNESQDDGQPVERFRKILGLLENLLLVESVDVVQAASACLKSIFCDRKGSQLARECEKKWRNVLSHLEPFRVTCQTQASSQSVDIFVADEMLGRRDLWWPPGGDGKRCHDDWIKSLACALISSTAVTDALLTKLLPVCQIQAGFAEKVFPYLVYDILSGEGAALKRTLSDLVQRFFDKVEESSTCPTCRGTDALIINCIACKKKASSMTINRRSVVVMLDAINFLRTQRKPGFLDSAWESNFWLDVNYLKLAHAAQLCSAYFLSLLYIEIWCGTRKAGRSVRMTVPSSFESVDSIDVLGGSGVVLRQDSLMRGNHFAALIEAYCHLSDPDGLLGAAALCQPSQSVYFRVYEQTGQWARVLEESDLHMQTSSDLSQVCLLKAMDYLGLSHMMGVYFQSLSRARRLLPEEIDCRYELAWKNCQWDIEGLSDPVPNCFNGQIFESLNFLRQGEFEIIPIILDEARRDICDAWSNAGMDSALEVYPLLARLQSLVEIEELCAALRKDTLGGLNRLWSARRKNCVSSVECLNVVSCVRTSAFKAAIQHEPEREDLILRLVDQLKSQVKLYQRFGLHQKMGCMLNELDAVVGRLQEPQKSLAHWECMKMKAELFWSRNEVDNALRFIKLLCRELSDANLPQGSLLYSDVLLLCGNWLAESQSESPSQIRTQYLEKAVFQAKKVSGETKEFLVRAHFSCARFADQQYQSITRRIESSGFASRRNVTSGQKEELEAIRKNPKARYNESLLVYSDRLQKQVHLDEVEEKVVLEDQRAFLATALRSYCLCLQAGDEFDVRVYRLCSLWFENSHISEHNSLVDEEFAKIDSRKFLPVMYQLAARLDSTSTDPTQKTFQSILRKTIQKACIDHPFHAVYIVMALGGGTTSDMQPPPAKKSKLSSPRQLPANDKAEAVGAILAAVRRKRPAVMSGIEILVKAYIELANTRNPDWKKGTYDLPRGNIKNITNLRTAILTDNIPVDMSCRYDDVPTVKQFHRRFRIPGGKSVPKMIVCVGSDGKERRQLVKGGDDLRQDAVMQQVFGVVNHLLARDADTKKRHLRMRTYKVISLTKDTGVVEWCDGTVPFGTYLVGDGSSSDSAHCRYGSGDWKAKECRLRISQVSKKPKNIRLKTFQSVAEHFRPVFRHFFTERFPQASEWYERKVAYSRSVAVSSMVGYIVGLGDRHVQNILIDQDTAELIHIDLGVAFEQGRLLPTPETTPFRLTRDVVDGMGATGVEGVFRCACEKTLALLRTSEEALTAIIEVLLHDPLSDWSAGRIKATKTQRQPVDDVGGIDYSIFDDGRRNRPEEETDGFATRVLLRVREKLEGIEDRVVLSVDGQVKHLIQAAMNPDNLCLLFHGWQAFV